LFVWWCLAPFNATYIVAVSFYWRRKPEDPDKTTDLSQITDKFYHIMLYTSPWSRFELRTSVVIGIDCIVVYPSIIRARPRRPHTHQRCNKIYQFHWFLPRNNIHNPVYYCFTNIFLKFDQLPCVIFGERCLISIKYNNIASF
jgi:hypothetical protein